MTRLEGLSPRRSRFLRFIVAGAINSFFGFAVYSASVLVGLPVWGALVVGNIAGVVFNFFTIGGYVFRSLVLTRLPRFATAYLFVYVINLKLIDWLSIWVTGSILAQGILTLPMALFSYFLMKKFVFATADERGQSGPGKSLDEISGSDGRKQ